MLTLFQRDLLLSLFPKGARILSAAYFPGEYLPLPIQVVVQRAAGSAETIVLRMVRHGDGDLVREVELFPLLARSGLPVPTVLIGPSYDPDLVGDYGVAVYTLLPGRTCQDLAEESPQGCARAIQLVLDATERMAQLTDSVRRADLQPALPEIRLIDDLDSFVQQGGEWMGHEQVIRAVDLLRPRLAQVIEPLVFTNGDYQPANFLTDGETLTGFLDFEYACFRDYLFGFVKFVIYDLHPHNKGGMIPALFQRTHPSPLDFALRMAVGCLKTLQREIPFEDDSSDYRAHVLGLLAESVETIERG
jgi:aminoglycoside phosphotransferase (APT) family kinase protein